MLGVTWRAGMMPGESRSSMAPTVPALIEEYGVVDLTGKSLDFSEHWQTIKSTAAFA